MYQLTLSEEEVNKILFALGELPAKNVIGLINKIHEICAERIQIATEVEATKNE